MAENHYRRLGLPRKASGEDVEAAYLRAEEQFRQARIAFEVLVDPQKRAQYDRTLSPIKPVRSSPKCLTWYDRALSRASPLPKCLSCGVEVAPDAGACWHCCRLYPSHEHVVEHVEHVESGGFGGARPFFGLGFVT